MTSKKIDTLNFYLIVRYIMNKIKSKFSPYILTWLNLPINNLYSLENLKDALMKKDPSSTIHKKYYFGNEIKLDDQGKLLFNTTYPTIRISTALTFISQNYLINCNKPNCNYYDFNQVPTNIDKIDI
jgi:hypothetical protein